MFEDKRKNTDPVEYIRYLLLLCKNKLEPKAYNELSLNMCYMLTRENGLINLINASIDFDESSQKQTTFNQRFLAIGTIVSGLPKLDCSLNQYYKSICDQLIKIFLLTTDEKKEKNLSQTTKTINCLLTIICVALSKRKKELFKQNFLIPIFNSFNGNNQITENIKISCEDKLKNEMNNFILESGIESIKLNSEKSSLEKLGNEANIENCIPSNESNLQNNNQSCIQSNSLNNKQSKKLNINDSIKLISILIVNNFPKKEMLDHLKTFYFLSCLIQNSNSKLKKDLNLILNELLNTNHSEYLIDKVLFENLDEFDKYKYVYNVENEKFELTNEPKNILNKIDLITQFTIDFIYNKNEPFIIDIFLVFLQRYTFNKSIEREKSLLICSLIDTLREKVIIIMINYPEKAVNFINLTLERLTLNFENNILSMSTELDNIKSIEENKELEKSIKEDSLNICLQIIELIIHKQLFESLYKNLEQTLKKLIKVITNSELNKEIKTKVLSLEKELKNKSFISLNKFEKETEFKTAINDLNSDLMPERAHALISLKKLIHAKNENIEKNKIQLITILKECLQDKESYIFLSAINTLSSLAVLYTDEILPILIETFTDKQRTYMDRLKVGQVIVYLTKQLNEMAHCYSKPIMNMFLVSAKDECDLIRVSTLSNLAEFCSVLKFKLNIYITEIMFCIEYTLKTDPSIEVKRACIMFFHLILNNLDKNSLIAIESELKNIYKLLKHVYVNTLDEVIQLHSQLALEQLSRIAKEILFNLPKITVIKPIKLN